VGAELLGIFNSGGKKRTVIEKVDPSLSKLGGWERNRRHLALNRISGLMAWRNWSLSLLISGLRPRQRYAILVASGVMAALLLQQDSLKAVLTMPQAYEGIAVTTAISADLLPLVSSPTLR
jgi:hypothetical protein